MRPQKGKQKIFTAAMMLFESQGYFATTVEQVTTEAGVSKGLVYNYFKSKDELLVGLIDDATDKMASVAKTFDSGDSMEESLLLFVDNYFSFLRNERQFLKLQLTLALMPELNEVVSKPQKQRSALLLKMVHGWFSRAKVAESKSKARLLLAMLDGIALHYLFIYDRYPLTSMKSQLMQAAKDLCYNANAGELL